jgi:hypothetical protein
MPKVVWRLEWISLAFLLKDFAELRETELFIRISGSASARRTEASVVGAIIHRRVNGAFLV